MATKIERGRMLSEQAYDLLGKRIKKMAPGNNRLPSEEELSREYGVSRATIREACNQLIAEGYLTKVQGKGMFGHPSAFALSNRIDLISDFKKLLNHQCKKVELQISHVRILQQSELKLLPPAEISGDLLAMDWVYLGDGRKSILGRFEFPLTSFREAPGNTILAKDLIDFGERYLRASIAYCAMYVNCGFDDYAAAMLETDPKRPLQCWSETIYDVEDNPAGRSIFYLHPDEVMLSFVTTFDGN